jgi:hypothetical protein
VPTDDPIQLTLISPYMGKEQLCVTLQLNTGLVAHGWLRLMRLSVIYIPPQHKMEVPFGTTSIMRGVHYIHLDRLINRQGGIRPCASMHTEMYVWGSQYRG